MERSFKDIYLPPKQQAALGFVYRRLALLVSLALGLIIFSAWLPSGAWRALLAALWINRTEVTLLLLSAMIAVSVVWSAGPRLDAWVFQLLNLRGGHAGWLDCLMGLATQLGNPLTAFLAAGLLFALDAGRLAAEAILGALTLWLIVEGIKLIPVRTRPVFDGEDSRTAGRQEQERDKEGGRSFPSPSGYTAQTFFLASLLSQQYQFGAAGTIVLYAIAVLVGYTRLYVGAHYPRGVVAGAILGSLWGILATLVGPYWFGLGF
jgi:membrane-associated phospholipid phosphatase